MHSQKLKQSDIVTLKDAIKTHLELFKTTFQQNLKPKQRNLIHYSKIIETMGPVIAISEATFQFSPIWKHIIF